MSAEHRLEGVMWTPSPHWDERPLWATMDLIVVHCISLPEGQFGTGLPQSLFLGSLDTGAHPTLADLEGARVSPHLFIDRQGLVQQFVSFDKRAWHAGVSTWRGREGCNDFSVGIELEGAADVAYTSAQYRAITHVFDALLARYPEMSAPAIVGHNEIAPGRKQDPGTSFNWRGLLLGLHLQQQAQEYTEK